MSDYREMLGALAVIIGLAGYALYFRDIFRGKTKPHAFSWLVWSVLTGIAFAAQITENAGAGSWITGITALACFTIFVFALFKGEKSFPVFDWIALVAAFISMLLWGITKDPMLSVILITLVDAIGFLPTYRKGFNKPFEETAMAFSLSAIKFIPALLALENYTISTWLYPASLVLMNGLFAVMLLIRRRQ